MRILHISLADPYRRGGGLNRFCRDLIDAQLRRGEEVYFLHPSVFVNSQHPQIIRAGKKRFLLFDGLPTAITYGIDDPQRYMSDAGIDTFHHFFQKLQPNVIHIHSIQGIPLSCFLAAKELKIPMVYTTHDFYICCPRGRLLDRNGKLCVCGFSEKCAWCNRGAGLPPKTQRLLQSEIYSRIKDLNFLRKYKSVRVENEKIVENTEPTESFLALRMYYKQIVDCFSLIHCNSMLSQIVIQRYYPCAKTKVLPISHAGIKEHYRLATQRRHIGYLGGPALSKGWQVLLQAVQLLESTPCKLPWSVWLYGGVFPEPVLQRDYVHFCGVFTDKEKNRIWNNIDILVVPSTGIESFGYVVLEALKYGIPVIASDLVGAKELLSKEWIYSHDQPQQLADCLAQMMDQGCYMQQCAAIREKSLPLGIDNMEQQVHEIYKICEADRKIAEQSL